MTVEVNENVKPCSKNIKRAKRVYLVCLVFINIFFPLLILLAIATSKEVDVIKISIFACITWLPLNIGFAIVYLRVGNAKSLKTMKSFDDMGKRDRKKLIIAALLSCIPDVLGIVMIIKGVVLIGCVLLFIGLFAFIYYQKKLLRKSKNKQMSNN